MQDKLFVPTNLIILPPGCDLNPETGTIPNEQIVSKIIDTVSKVLDIAQ